MINSKKRERGRNRRSDVDGVSSKSDLKDGLRVI